MHDNLALSTNKIRNSVSTLRKKVNQAKFNLDQLTIEIDKIMVNVDDLLTQADIYRQRVERKNNREVKALSKELQEAKRSTTGPRIVKPSVSEESLKIASTIGIFECVLRQICGTTSDDFRLMSYSLLFPSIYERVVRAEEEAYFLETLPDSTLTVVERGRGYLGWLREECDTHLTEGDSWETYSPYITEWWKNDALPLLYGSRDEQWELDEPLSLVEMISWRDNPGERPLLFPSVWDAYEIYNKHKDAVFESSGIRAFDLKMFVNNGDK